MMRFQSGSCLVCVSQMVQKNKCGVLTRGIDNGVVEVSSPNFNETNDYRRILREPSMI